MPMAQGLLSHGQTGSKSCQCPAMPRTGTVPWELQRILAPSLPESTPLWFQSSPLFSLDPSMWQRCSGWAPSPSMCSSGAPRPRAPSHYSETGPRTPMPPCPRKGLACCLTSAEWKTWQIIL